MEQIIIYICLGVMLVSGVMAVVLRSIIKDAMCLAVASASLGLIMYILGAPYAALFEVSVCSGLITVIFISGISLSHESKEEVRKEFDDRRQMNILPIALVLTGAIFIAYAVKFGVDLPEPATPLNLDFKQIFWGMRSTDIWGQIIVMLAGGMAIQVLIKEEKKRK